VIAPRYRRPRWDSNLQPPDPKEWDPSGDRVWDAGSLPGDLKTRDARYFPGTQDEAARLMDEILTPIPIYLISINPKGNKLTNSG
jgi:hypothetical protein